MRLQRNALIAALAAVFILGGPPAPAAEDEAGRLERAGVMKMTEGWPKAAQSAALATARKYGMPQWFSRQALVWNDNGPWKRTVVTREEPEHLFPAPHKDVLVQTVGYRVPVERFDDLARFDGSLVLDRTRGEVTSSAQTEEDNLLALNLADEIVKGAKTVEEAQRFMADTVAASMAGRSSKYTEKLLFKVRHKVTADPEYPRP